MTVVPGAFEKQIAYHVVELGINIEIVVERTFFRNERSRRGSEIIVSDGGVGAKCGHGTVRSGSHAVPCLQILIALADEENVLVPFCSRIEEENRLRLFKSTQVVKIAFLPVFVLDISITHVLRLARKDCRASRLHLLHECLAPLGEDIHVQLNRLRARNAGEDDAEKHRLLHRLSRRWLMMVLLSRIGSAVKAGVNC